MNKPATPLPWSRKDGHFQNVRTEDIDYFIHAANAYPELVKAIRDVCTIRKTYFKSAEAFRVHIQDNARALLAKLGEG